jgi:hypothetical protein
MERDAAPEAQETVAATDQEIAEIAVHLPCMLSEDLPLDGQCRATDPSKRFRIPCDEAFFFPVERLLARIESDASTIATLRKAVPTWIPVAERLPEPFAIVLVYGVAYDNLYCDDVSPYIDVAYRAGDRWRLDLENSVNLTHWMPLPDPPAALDEKGE